MRRRTFLLSAASILLAACSSDLEPIAPVMLAPSLDIDTAQQRWLAFHPANYVFEVLIQSSSFITPGFRRAEVVNNRLVSVRDAKTGESVPLNEAMTIDDIWAALNRARAADVPLSNLEFSAEGIPLHAVTGRLEVDSGTVYLVRAFEVR